MMDGWLHTIQALDGIRDNFDDSDFTLFDARGI